MSPRCAIILLAFVAGLAGGPALAQQAPAPASAVDEAAAANAAEQARVPERIEIGLSTQAIGVTSDFTGQALTIFGAIDNVDPLVHRQGRYDIFVIIEGPRSELVTRRKARVFGIWMNVESQSFDNTPQSYLIASTRLARDITSLDTLARLSLGIGQIRVQPHPDKKQAREVEAFTAALRRLKQDAGLYREFPGGVQFISQSLFRAEVALPANVPLGQHRARAYLFRNGELVGQTQAPLRIAKAGFEFAISDFARNHSLYYGLASVLLALFIGWLGRIVFKKD
ncbi:MAG: TIGR02186 family protein [Roseitalea sp.]|jgi:uncharacterized protein (TIGR02186 family)|nr:TIGR02186 family protein [Roseitalea sp.]MBO6722474.1 TIGR02186 family protein [Roseitalea sp.]MBO6742982.1 TIGR02186 family protein [Roseitalea sp.]